MNQPMRLSAMIFKRTIAVAAVVLALAAPCSALEKEISLVTGQPLGELAVAGRLSVDLHAEFMVSREYGTETVLNWYNCGYSGGGGENGTITTVGGQFGDFGFQVPFAQRQERYPHAVTVDKMRAVRFDGNDFLEGNFAVESKNAGAQHMAIEVWFRSAKPDRDAAILGWQSRDGKETSGTIGYPADFAGSDAWRHLIVNCTPDTEDWFLDGVKVRGGKRATLVTAGHVLVLGGASAARPSFRGDLVAVRLHDQALTPEEIAHNFQGGPRLGTEMHNWWRTEPDKWWVRESEHFRHAVDKAEMAAWTAQQRKDFENRLPAMFDMAELIYRTYSERLAMRSSVVSRRPEKRGDGIKYKVPIQPSGGSWMGVDADFGWACQGAGHINPHELAHGWQAMTGNMQGNYWETHANFPQTYNGIYQTIPVVAAECSAFPSSGRTYYHDRAMFEHLAQTPEYGPMFISKLWYDGPTATDAVPFPWITFTRINPCPDRTLADEYARMVMRNVTWDYTTFQERRPGQPGNTPHGNDGVVSAENLYRKTADNLKAEILRSYIVLESIPYEPHWWRVPKEQAPQQLGWNICPLKFKPGTVKATLGGFVNPARGSDWRAGFVGVDAHGKPVYGQVFGLGTTQSFDVTDNIQELYLAVCATPSKIMAIDMVGDFRSFEQEPFPYKVKLEGCEPWDVLAAAKPTVAGAPHPNGGGFVESTAQVEATAYVGPGARVLGTSQVLGQSRVEDDAVVRNATVKDRALVSGHALVTESASVAEDARVRDYAVVKAATTVAGHAKVLEHAVVATRKVCSGYVTMKGVAFAYGGNQSGTALLDGFYAKGNEITNGKWFTWSWGQGKNPGEIDEDFGGLYADYVFDREHPWMARDAFGVTWGYLANAPHWVETPERQRRISVLLKPETTVRSFERPPDGENGYAHQMAGYILPPETGDYAFWLSADDEGALWIGKAGADKADERLCGNGFYAEYRKFDKFPTQKSALVRLEKGQAYPLNLVHRNGHAGGSLSVAWIKPGNSTPEPIPAECLAVTADGRQPGLIRREWGGVRDIQELLQRPGYPDGFLSESSRALALNGKDQFVELPKDVADMQTCTYTAEFKWEGGPPGQRVFEFANPNGNALWLSPDENGQLVFAIHRGTETQQVAAGAANKGLWTTVQVVINDNLATLLVDGKKVAEKDDVTLKPEDVKAAQCYLGRGLDGGYFSGAIGRFTIHSVPLFDRTPPTPDPAAFTLPPTFVTLDTLVLSAVPGSDPLGSVEYLFEEEGGAWNSGWTNAPSIRVGNKDAAHPKRYRVTLRDKLGNEGRPSAFVPADGLAADTMIFAGAGEAPIVIEAEHFARNVPSADGFQWELKTDPAGHVGTGCMQILPERRAQVDPATTAAARMDYLVNLPKPGRYFVWLRTFGGDPGSDSVHLGFDLQIGPAGNNVGLAANRMYVWSGRRAFDVDTSGIHTFSLWMREDGAIVDRILITPNGAYEPEPDQRAADKSLSGRGPAESSAHPWQGELHQTSR